MKSVFTGILFLIIWQSVAAQETSTQSSQPDIFQAALMMKYPDASDVLWWPNSKGKIASFKSGGRYLESSFNEKGGWIYSSVPIEFEELPQPAIDTLMKGTFKNWQKGSTSHVVSSDGRDYYKILVYSPEWDEFELNFDRDGHRLEEVLH
ncbi:MAG: hypothetical protein PHX54_12455 [Lentimicrobiaceae bacterium]|nr:hypothetical protein [Lentimicrobiaceae bacterium]